MFKSASFGDEKIVPTIFLVDVWTFRVDFCKSLPQLFRLRQGLSGLDIDLKLFDGTSWLLAFAMETPTTLDIRSIILEEEARVNTVEIEENRITPVVGSDVSTCYVEVLGTKIRSIACGVGTNDIEDAFVKSYSGSPETSCCNHWRSSFVWKQFSCGVFKRNLTWSVDSISYSLVSRFTAKEEGCEDRNESKSSNLTRCILEDQETYGMRR